MGKVMLQRDTSELNKYVNKNVCSYKKSSFLYCLVVAGAIKWNNVESDDEFIVAEKNTVNPIEEQNIDTNETIQNVDCEIPADTNTTTNTEHTYTEPKVNQFVQYRLKDEEWKEKIGWIRNI